MRTARPRIEGSGTWRPSSPLVVYGLDVGDSQMEEGVKAICLVVNVKHDFWQVWVGPPPALMPIQMLANFTYVGVVMWRAGLRIQEALGLTEADLDQRRGSLLVRRGKGGRRREVGMDTWGWEQLQPWLALRRRLPVGPLFCIINGTTRGRHWSPAAARAYRGRVGRATPPRAAPAPARPRGSRWLPKACR